jgi:MFS transporter, OFA family, oxalate/formate antiporter
VDAGRQVDEASEPRAHEQAGIYYGYWLVGLAFIAQFVAVGVQNYVIGAFLTPMTQELGWTRAEYTISRTLAQVVLAVAGLFIGIHVDRHGGRGLMLAGTALLSAALVAHGWIDALWQWIALNGLILTLGAALVGNLVVNVTLAKWFVAQRGRAVAIAAMGVSFAGVLLTPLSTLLVDSFGWRAAWQMLGGATALLMLPVSAAMRRAPEDHGLHPDGLSHAEVAAGHGERAALDLARSLTRAQALRSPSFYLLVLAFGLFFVNIGVVLLQTIPFLTDSGFSRTEAALMITVTSVPSLLSKPAWGYFIDRLNARPLAALGAGITGVSLLIIVLAARAGSQHGVWAGYFLLGIGWGGMIPLQEVIWAGFFGRAHLGAVRSAALPFSLFLSAAGPILTSYYYDVMGNYDGALLTVAVLSVASAAMLGFVPEPSAPAARSAR